MSRERVHYFIPMQLSANSRTMKLHDWESVSRSHLHLMRFFGLLPLDGKTFDFFATKLLMFYAVLINVFYNSPYTYYAIDKFSKKIFEAEYICEAVVVQRVFFCFVALQLSRGQITNLVNNCRELWCHLTDEETETVLKFERKARKFRNFLIGNGIAICTAFYGTFFILTASIPKDQKPLVFKFFVEIHTEPWYTIVMIMQFVVNYTIAVQMGVVENIGLYLIMMACGYLRVIRIRLLAFSEKNQPEDDEIINEEIVECVKFHQAIMQYCLEIEKLLSKVYTITVITTVYNISIIGIKLLENGDDKFIYITMLTNNVFVFFVVQWAPEHLLAESAAISHAAYCASQRHEPQLKMKMRKTLLLMMLRSQRPMQLTAGGVISLSIETFGAMIKNAFSFFAVLRSFAE